LGFDDDSTGSCVETREGRLSGEWGWERRGGNNGGAGAHAQVGSSKQFISFERGIESGLGVWRKLKSDSGEGAFSDSSMGTRRPQQWGSWDLRHFGGDEHDQ